VSFDTQWGSGAIREINQNNNVGFGEKEKGIPQIKVGETENTAVQVKWFVRFVPPGRKEIEPEERKKEKKKAKNIPKKGQNRATIEDSSRYPPKPDGKEKIIGQLCY